MIAEEVAYWLSNLSRQVENPKFRNILSEASRLLVFQKKSMDALLKANATLAEKCAPWMEAEQQGRMLILPCAIGAKVYHISWCDEMVDGERCPYDCNSVQRDHVFKTDCIKFCGIYECEFSLRMLDWIGDTVFLTREEAEQKLEEKANDKAHEKS